MRKMTLTRSQLSLIILFAFGTLTGCNGSNRPPTYPVHGKVQLGGADVKVLAGSHIEAAHTLDSLVRASGEIKEDGSFELQTYQAGAIVAGAPEGRYEVRIILNDDDRNLRLQAARSLARRFLDFKASGVTVDIPATEDVTIGLSSQ